MLNRITRFFNSQYYIQYSLQLVQSSGGKILEEVVETEAIPRGAEGVL